MAQVQRERLASRLKFSLPAQETERLIAISSPLLLLLLWEVLARYGVIDQRFFPAPTRIFAVMGEMIVRGDLWTHISVSLWRLAVGLMIGGVPALVLGVIMGLNRKIYAFFDPLISATYPIPKSSILPLALLIFGLGEASKIFMVAIGVFYPMVINAATGVRGISQIYLDVGTNYGANPRQVFMKIALPGAMPVILTGVRLGVGMGLVLIAIAEMVGAKSGLGYMIWAAWETFAVEQMYVGLFCVAIIGFLLNVGVNQIEKVLVPWRRV
ncbi:ABC transporter permease [Pseudochelatococcus sp. B33]